MDVRPCSPRARLDGGQRRGGSTGMDGPWLPALLSGAVPPACNRICSKQLECNNGSSLASPPAALQPFCSPVPCPPPASPGSPAQPQTPQILQAGLPTLHLEGFPVCWCFPGELRPSSAVVHLQFSFPRSSQGFPQGRDFLVGTWHRVLVSLLHPLCAGSRGSTTCPEHLLRCFGNFIYEMNRVSV